MRKRTTSKLTGNWRARTCKNEQSVNVLSSSVHSLYPFELLSKTRRIDERGSRGKGRDTIWKLIALFYMSRSANCIKCTRRDHVDHREQVSRTIDVISGLIRDYRHCTRMYKHSSHSLRYFFSIALNQNK